MNNDLLTPPLLREQLTTSHAECLGQYVLYIVDVARGLVLFKTSPNSLAHLTTIVRPVVNDC